MRLLVSWLRDFVDVTASPGQIAATLGLRGFEVATAYDLPLRTPSADPGAKVRLAPTPIGENDRLRVTLEDAELCPRYAVAVAALTPASSPSWMTTRLQAA